MATEGEKDIKLNIEEARDGSAVVDLPESMLAGDGDAGAGGDSGSQNDAGDEDDNPNDSEAVRSAKRARRRAKKDLIRKTNEEKDVRLQQLQRENEEFKRRLSYVERETKQGQIARIDKNIEDQRVRMEYAKMKLSEAVQAGDGEAMVEAQSLWNEAQATLGEYNKVKNAVERDNQPKQDFQVVDPSVQRNAADWMRRNSWYRPDTSDQDSKIAKKVDELLVTEGWNPSDPDYWDELDSRLHKALPHRYNESTGSDSAVRKPRNVVGSSGREASAAYGGNNRTQFVLSPERVKAMKEVGAWDNPVRKKAMIDNFVKYDRENARRN
jgi:hypothetical protein|tara:strand:- start:5116 stop:6090 length:975 start_codon:yes stop_codon:yes gene_type:complete